MARKQRTRSQTQPALQQVDRGWFDGSADPNPGGQLGLGWHWILRDNTTYARGDQLPPSPSNTNNRAEYQALMGLLADYLAQGYQGPLIVHGDSELIINQVTGDYTVHDDALAQLHACVSDLAAQIAGGVRFKWVPRRLNALADRLASGMSEEVARAPRQDIYAAAPAQGVPQPLTNMIARLNRQESLSFRDGLSLRVGGQDQYSKWKLPELQAAAGKTCCNVVEQAFLERHAASDEGRIKFTERVLRWCLRGLEAHHAVRKVLIDDEVSANARQRPE